MRHGSVPWVDGDGPAPLLGMLVFGAASFVGIVRLGERWSAASGEATLDATGATFRKGGLGLEHRYAWSELAGYRDGTSVAVELVPAGQRVGGAISSIPTPTEADRVAVLAFLDARGLRRLE
jgi:hypothetical protein